MIIYEAYKEGHYKKGFPPMPYVKNGKTIYPEAKPEWVPTEKRKVFKDENKCIKYCVKHGCRYREIEVED